MTLYVYNRYLRAGEMFATIITTHNYNIVIIDRLVSVNCVRTRSLIIYSSYYNDVCVWCYGRIMSLSRANKLL